MALLKHSLRNIFPGHRGAVESGLLSGGQTYIDKVLGLGPIAYWPLYEAAGPTAACLVNPLQDGTYTGVTLADALGPDGVNYAPFFDGANDYVDVHSATLAAAFNSAEGSVVIWVRVNAAGVWADGVERKLFRFRVDANNYVEIYKAVGADRLRWAYNAGGVLVNQTLDPVTNTGWFCAGITWSATADELWAYYNGGVVVGVVNGLGVWAGNLNANTTNIGATNHTPDNEWHGWESHAPVFDRALTGPEMLDIATV